MEVGIGGIISLTITVIVLTSVLMPTIKNANTTDFTSGELALWGVGGLIAIAGFIYALSAVFGLSR